ncbi:hypothetical protein ACOCEA_09540 [Maribacter sp. CXY002]|uniref:hypothetical protein n=1 Tax=Maribacter luteocoastalis TaxID=3407671 RepID=UPI003B671037
MKINQTKLLVKNNLPDGFFYIGQDNYFISNLNNPSVRDKHYLYSDSATSCIIVIVEGKDKDSNPIIALSHLSRTERFLAFFKIVSKTFHGQVSIFAQGANPPQPALKNNEYTYTSLLNEKTVINWINDNIFIPSASSMDKNDSKPNWYISQSSLSLGLGNPQLDDRGCYGIDLGTMIVSNEEFVLTPLQRDPTGGVQTLYCVFGLKVKPQIVLQLASQDFTPEQIKLLVDAANKENWVSILKMTKDEVLNKYSSTPQYEAPWFYESLRISAEYVLNYNNKN